MSEGPAFLFRVSGGSEQRPDFKLDNTMRESSSRRVNWTKYAIESQAEISNYGWRGERSFMVEGMKSALPLQAGATEDSTRVSAALEELDKLADGRTPIVLVMRFRKATCVLEEVSDTRDPSLGNAVNISIKCTTITRARSRAITVARSRLSNRKRRKSGRSKTAGPNWNFQCGSIDDCAKKLAQTRSEARLLRSTNQLASGTDKWGFTTARRTLSSTGTTVD